MYLVAFPVVGARGSQGRLRSRVERFRFNGRGVSNEVRRREQGRLLGLDDHHIKKVPRRRRFGDAQWVEVGIGVVDV